MRTTTTTTTIRRIVPFFSARPVTYIVCIGDPTVEHPVDSVCNHCNGNGNVVANTPPARKRRTHADQPAPKRTIDNHAVNSFAGVRNNEIGTPEALYRLLDDEFHFTHDPCPLIRQPGTDGLVDAWGERNFVNPPYSDTEHWVAKAVNEMLQHRRLSVLLIPFRQCSFYWDTLIWDNAREVRMFTKRIRFEGYHNTFPVPMCLVVFDPKASVTCSLPCIGEEPYRTRIVTGRH